MSLLPYFDPRHMLPRSMKNEVGQLPPTGEMYKEYIRIALPSVCEMVLISLINMMDTVMVSSIGTDAVAAVGLVGQPRMIMLSLFFALNTGITAVIARRKGEDNSETTPEEIEVCEKVTGFRFEDLWDRNNAIRLTNKKSSLQIKSQEENEEIC